LELSDEGLKLGSELQSARLRCVVLGFSHEMASLRTELGKKGRDGRHEGEAAVPKDARRRDADGQEDVRGKSSGDRKAGLQAGKAGRCFRGSFANPGCRC
jgi:hypothetical protein